MKYLKQKLEYKCISVDSVMKIEKKVLSTSLFRAV